MMRYVLLIIIASSLAGCSRETIVKNETQLPESTATQDIPAPSLVEEPKQTPRERVVSEAQGLIGLRETHGRNRSPVIDKMNLFANANLGDPWCASFNAWIYHLAEIPKFPKSAWSPSWVANPTWTRKAGGKNPLPGDPFGIYFANKGRVAHTGLIEKWGDAVITLEGNTGPTGSIGEADRNGEGSHKKRRLKSQIYSVRNWID
jgi:hypothetical protein